MRNPTDSLVGILGLQAGDEVNMRKPIIGVLIATLATIISSLASCGGGGSDNFVKTKTACPSSKANDIWANNRLGCAVVGEPFVDQSKNATGTRVDRAFGIAQIAYDDASAPLNGGKTRYFEYLLCVVGVPDQALGKNIAGDLQVVLELAYTSHYLPPGISLTALAADSMGLESVPHIDEPCDPTKHPVIVDYATGLVQSINTGALPALTIYDK